MKAASTSPNHLGLAEHVCLAIIRDRATHGWAIVKLLAPNGDIGRIWTLSRALTYRAIDGLITKGMITRDVSTTTPKNNRATLVATDHGQRESDAWLGRPVEHLRDVRTELLVKIALRTRSDLDISALLTAQQEQFEPTIEALTASTGHDLIDVWRRENARAIRRFLDLSIRPTQPTPNTRSDMRLSARNQLKGICADQAETIFSAGYLPPRCGPLLTGGGHELACGWHNLSEDNEREMTVTGDQRNGGHVVVDALVCAGVSTVFALHGVQIDPIFQACADAGLSLIDLRHEASAGFAAEGYARVSGSVGAVAVCPGPGFTNVLTSVANASIDRTPVVYLVGSTPGATLESNGLQVGLDHLAMAAPVAKWTCKVTGSEHLARLMAQAIRIATTAPCGPVVIDLPADVLAAAAADQTVPNHTVGIRPTMIAEVDTNLILGQLAMADRPVLMIGHTPSAAARTATNTFTATTGVPCFVGYGAIGTLADDDPNYGGTLYQLGRLPDNSRPDVALAVGVQFGFDTPGLRDGGRGWGTTIVHVDADPAEIARFAPVGLGLVADPDAVLVSLAERVGSGGWPSDVASAPKRSQWAAEVRAIRNGLRAQLDVIEPHDGLRLHPYAAARVVSDVVAASGAVLICDGAVCKHWLHDALRLPFGARYLTHGRFGCMGMGPGLSIGAALAEPGLPIVCVTGDGAAGFALAEFEAMVRHGLRITTIVLNNARWGASQGFQLRPGGRQQIVGTTLTDANYHEVMVAFGGRGERVSTLDHLRASLAKAVASPVATCLNVSTHAVGVAPEIPQLNA